MLPVGLKLIVLVVPIKAMVAIIENRAPIMARVYPKNCTWNLIFICIVLFVRPISSVSIVKPGV